MTTTTLYPPLPQLAPRGAQEAAEQYGLRALLFITAERLTCTVDQEGLELAAHTFRLAVCNRDLTTDGAERLADVGRMITGALARRQEAAQPAQEAPQATTAPAGEDKPRFGPGAPLAPAPTRPTPPSAARRVKPAPVATPSIRLAPVAPALAAEELF